MIDMLMGDKYGIDISGIYTEVFECADDSFCCKACIHENSAAFRHYYV
jgi:hypothetical protein